LRKAVLVQDAHLFQDRAFARFAGACAVCVHMRSRAQSIPSSSNFMTRMFCD
jgi:hypothetical protein